jgi:hypothetical protein
MVRMLGRWGPVPFSTVTVTVKTFQKQAIHGCPEWHADSLLILKSMCFCCYIPVTSSQVAMTPQKHLEETLLMNASELNYNL